MKQVKKVLSLVLAFVLSFGCMSNVALAEETGSDVVKKTLMLGKSLVLEGAVTETPTVDGIIAVDKEMSGVTKYQKDAIEAGEYFFVRPALDRLLSNNEATTGNGFSGLVTLNINLNELKTRDEVWKVTAADGGYTISDITGKYIDFPQLAWGNGNVHLKLTDNANFLFNFMKTSDDYKYKIYHTMTQDDATKNFGIDRFEGYGNVTAAYSGDGNEWYLYTPNYTGNTVITGLAVGTTSITVGETTYEVTVEKEIKEVSLEVGEEYYLDSAIAETVEATGVLEVGYGKGLYPYVKVEHDANNTIPSGMYLIANEGKHIMLNTFDGDSSALDMENNVNMSNNLVQKMWKITKVEGETNIFTIQDIKGRYLQNPTLGNDQGFAYVATAEEATKYEISWGEGRDSTIGFRIMTANANASGTRFAFNRLAGGNNKVGLYQNTQYLDLWEFYASSTPVITATGVGVQEVETENAIYRFTVTGKNIVLNKGEKLTVPGSANDVTVGESIVDVKIPTPYAKIKNLYDNTIADGTYLLGVTRDNGNTYLLTGNEFSEDTNALATVQANFDGTQDYSAYMWNVDFDGTGYIFRDMNGKFLNISNGRVTMSDTYQNIYLANVEQKNGASNRVNAFGIRDNSNHYLNSRDASGQVKMLTWSGSDNAWFFYATEGWVELTATKGGTTDVTIGGIPYHITVISDEAVTVEGIENTTGKSVGTVTGGGVYRYGTTTTITATEKFGYDFLGWFEKQVDSNDYSKATPITKALSCEITVDDSNKFVAVYEANGKVTLTITDAEKATITDAEGKTLDVTAGVKTGTQVTVTYTGEAKNFLHWQNASGKVVNTEVAYTFTVVNNTTLTPVAKSETTGKAWVEFVNEYNQVLSASMWAQNGSDGLIITTPSKLGYTFSGWAFENAPKTAVDAAAVRKAIEAGATHVRLVPVYAKAAVNHTVTYKNNSEGAANKTATVELGATCTVNANDVAVNGQKFSHWTMGGKVVSYNASYTFLVTGDVTLTAVFTEEETVETASILEITSQYVIENGETVEKVAFVASREIAAGYTVLEHGMLYAKDCPIADTEAFVEGTDGVNKFTASGTGTKGALTLNVRLGEATSIKVRAYAIVKNDTTGEVTTLYSGMATYTK